MKRTNCALHYRLTHGTKVEYSKMYSFAHIFASVYIDLLVPTENMHFFPLSLPIEKCDENKNDTFLLQRVYLFTLRFCFQQTEDLSSEEGRWIGAMLAVTITPTGYEQFTVQKLGVYRIFSNWVVERQDHMRSLFSHFASKLYCFTPLKNTIFRS